MLKTCTKIIRKTPRTKTATKRKKPRLPRANHKTWYY